MTLQFQFLSGHIHPANPTVNTNAGQPALPTQPTLSVTPPFHGFVPVNGLGPVGATTRAEAQQFLQDMVAQPYLVLEPPRSFPVQLKAPFGVPMHKEAVDGMLPVPLVTKPTNSLLHLGAEVAKTIMSEFHHPSLPIPRGTTMKQMVMIYPNHLVSMPFYVHHDSTNNFRQVYEGLDDFIQAGIGAASMLRDIPQRHWDLMKKYGITTAEGPNRHK
jgi:hypothetical protein